MKPRNLGILLVAGAIALPIAAFSAAGPDGPAGCGPMSAMHRGGMQPMAMGSFGGPGMMAQMRRLDLTDSQQDRIFALMHAQAPTLREKGSAVAKAAEELHRLAAADPFDAAKAKSAADGHGRAVAEMAMLHAETESKVRALLTPEQRKAMDEAAAQRDDHRHGGPHWR